MTLFEQYAVLWNTGLGRVLIATVIAALAAIVLAAVVIRTERADRRRDDAP